MNTEEMKIKIDNKSKTDFNDFFFIRYFFINYPKQVL